MNELIVYAGVLLAALVGIAGILHALAALERAKHPELAKRLEAGDHFVVALAGVLTRVGGGEAIMQAVIEEVQSPHGKDFATDALAFLQGLGASPGSSTTTNTPSPGAGATSAGPGKIGVILFALALAFGASGCSATQVAAEKAAAASMLQGLAQGVDWVNLHPEDAKLVLEQARKVSSNPTLQAVIDKAEESNTAGNREALQASLSAGSLLLAPTPPGNLPSAPPNCSDDEGPPLRSGPGYTWPRVTDLPTPLRPRSGNE